MDTKTDAGLEFPATIDYWNIRYSFEENESGTPVYAVSDETSIGRTRIRIFSGINWA